MSTGTLQSVGDAYVLLDEPHGLRVEVDQESNLPGLGAPHFAGVDRTVYRMGKVDLSVLAAK